MRKSSFPHSRVVGRHVDTGGCYIQQIVKYMMQERRPMLVLYTAEGEREEVSYEMSFTDLES